VTPSEVAPVARGPPRRRPAGSVVDDDAVVPDFVRIVGVGGIVGDRLIIGGRVAGIVGLVDAVVRAGGRRRRGRPRRSRRIRVPTPDSSGSSGSSVGGSFASFSLLIEIDFR